jgi:hypothetical protein
MQRQRRFVTVHQDADGGAVFGFAGHDAGMALQFRTTFPPKGGEANALPAFQLRIPLFHLRFGLTSIGFDYGFDNFTALGAFKRP